MEHHPARQVMQALITFPSVIFNDNTAPMHPRIRSRAADLQQKEEELRRLQSELTERSKVLDEKEQTLSERRDAGRIYSIPIAAIEPNPDQPRRVFNDLTLLSLSDSIRAHGILQPLTVRIKPSEDPSCASAPTYQLIAGERRLRAAAAIGMECVPCMILDADNRRAAELALIENLQRENLNLFEQASAIAALIDMHSMTQDEIAHALSVSQSCIANKLRVLRLTADERELILNHHLTERHARAFLRIRDLELRRTAVRTTAEKGFNVAQTEEYIDILLSAPIVTGPQSAQNTVHRVTESSDESPSVRKCILKDLRLFFNTVERAMTAAREAGFQTECLRDENESGMTVTVTLRRPSDGCTSNPTKTVSRETETSAENANIR